MAEGTFENSALVLVDIQNDFLPGGSLAVRGGDSIIGNVNALVKEFSGKGRLVVLTRDWHPSDHWSFAENGGRWPDHCVQDTKGAEFSPDLLVPENAVIISKGTDPKKEAYSGFEGTDLLEVLNRNGAKKLVVCGLATDYCVKGTAEDALRFGFETFVVLDCVKGVDANAGDSERALEHLKSLGSRNMTSKEMLNLQPKKAKLKN